MAYSRRGYGRRSYAPTSGRVDRPNRRPGACRSCGVEVPASGGLLWREDSGAWSVVHRPAVWSGSPVSGRYVGGCPEATAKLNAGPTADEVAASRALSDAAVAAVAALASREAPRDSRGGYVDECGSCGMASCAC
jgi:hypothetical protein